MWSVGTYQVLRTLARGGMAELLLARTERSHGFAKLVVIKRIHPHLADDPGFVDMFLDEARLAAQLDHPNVVQVFDIGEAHDGTFFTMEYLRGADVRRLLEANGGPLPLEHAISIAVGAAAGLHHAHTKVGIDGRPLSVIHRDVSPNNIIVTYEGAVKVLDFGIAKATTNQRHTRQSQLKGKIAYMSPEQCSGATLDARSDIFSLGAVLYEMTTGVRAFDGESEFATMSAIVNRPVVAPRERVPSYPEALQTIVLRAMAPQPEDRHPTAAALRGELEAYANQAGVAGSSGALGEFVRAQVPEDIPTTQHSESDVPPRHLTAPTVSVSPPSAEPTIQVLANRRSRSWGLAAVGIAGVGVIAWQLAPPTGAPESTAAVGHPAPDAASKDAAPMDAAPMDAAPKDAAPKDAARDVAVPEPTPDPEPVALPPPTPKKKRPFKTKPSFTPSSTATEDTKVDGNDWVPIRRKDP